MRKVIAFAQRTAPLWNMFSGLLALVGLVGGLWAIWQYLEQKEAERQKYTLELVGVWQEDGYLTSYDRLTEKVVHYMDAVPRSQLEDAVANPLMHERLQENFTRRLAGDGDILADVKRVVYFFKWLNICLSQDLCSRDTAVAFYDDTISTFVENYSVFIKLNEKILPASLDVLEGLSRKLNDAHASS